VNEAEFRLTDELFDVGKIVSAPNGKSLSLVYEQALNNLVPKYQNDALRAQRERIRSWLLSKVDGPATGHAEAGGSGSRMFSLSTSESGNQPEGRIYGMQHFGELMGSDGASTSRTQMPRSTIPSSGKMRDMRAGSTPPSMSRIEFSQVLMLDYLQQRMDWELTRDKMMRKAMESGDTSKLEQVTRLLAHITAVHESRLSAKYGDVVVRGHLHTVREYLGYLDVKSTAESLQAAKDSLRESAMSSVYGSRIIYPVLMSPVDWFVLAL
jgi:hypothetical protein